jgi:hypothetical protein
VEEINPAIAERGLLVNLEQGDISDPDDGTVIMMQPMLMAPLVGDEEYSKEELDQFLKRARCTADEWLEE